MSYKFKLGTSIFVILLVAILTTAAASGWGGPLLQMDMPTDTVQPQATSALATPYGQNTPVPAGSDSQQSLPSPVMTSIFTGYTPYPNATYMAGTGMMAGMGGMGSMGSNGMIVGSGVMTGTMGMSGMGSMGMGDMASCPMMSGSSMSGSSMSGMDMGTDLSMIGMDMGEVSGSVEYSSGSVWSNPWLLLGWIVLVLVVLAILTGTAFGIAWLVRRLRPAPPALP
jgi:hypothetical protein